MKDLFLLLDSAISKGKGPPPPSTTSKNSPSTLTEAYMTENRSEKVAERGRKTTKDQEKTTQRKAAAEKPPKQSLCRWKRRRQQKNHSPEATPENPRSPREKTTLSVAGKKVQRNSGGQKSCRWRQKQPGNLTL